MHVAESGITDKPNYGTMNDIVDGSRDEEGEENGEDSKDPEGSPVTSTRSSRCVFCPVKR